MSLPVNYHTHNRWCDGQAEIGTVVEAARVAGLRQVGISSHAPVPFPTTYALPLARLAAYRDEVLRLREYYRGTIDVVLGLELDAIPSLARFNREQVLSHGFDYAIGSVHYLGVDDEGRPWPLDTSAARFAELVARRYGGDIRALVGDYYALVGQLGTHPGVAIVGHLDRGAKLWNGDGRYFSEDAPWYRAAVEGALRQLAAAGTIVELSTGGWRKGLGAPFPSGWIVRRCHELGIPMTPSTDCHQPDEIVAGYDAALAVLLAGGYREIAVYDPTRRVWAREPLPAVVGPVA